MADGRSREASPPPIEVTKWRVGRFYYAVIGIVLWTVTFTVILGVMLRARNSHPLEKTERARYD